MQTLRAIFPLLFALASPASSQILLEHASKKSTNAKQAFTIAPLLQFASIFWVDSNVPVKIRNTGMFRKIKTEQNASTRIDPTKELAISLITASLPISTFKKSLLNLLMLLKKRSLLGSSSRTSSPGWEKSLCSELLPA